jgi:hypothetical protein
LAGLLAAFATAFADFTTPLTSLPTFNPFAFAMAPQPLPCWRAVATWLRAVENGTLDCWLIARASRFAMEKAVDAQVAFSSPAIFVATCCDPAEVAAALFTVFPAFSNGS